MIQSHSQKWLQDPVSHINSGTSSIRYLLDSPGIRTYCSSGCSSRRSKRKKAYKVHAAVDTLGHLLALRVGSAGEQDRARVGELAEATRSAPRRRVTFSFALPSCLWYPAPGGCAPLGLRRRGKHRIPGLVHRQAGGFSQERGPPGSPSRFSFARIPRSFQRQREVARYSSLP